MRRTIASILLLTIVSSTTFAGAIPSSFEYTEFSNAPKLRWRGRTIKIALSKSLGNPGANIKLNSDVIGAARRALSRWSGVVDLHFEITETSTQSISPSTSADGISLITVADTPQNNAIFSGSYATGRTRVFFDNESGEISEADIVINPHPASAEGQPVQFSTDGTRGTYDLESTFTHEIGHLLGLDHSQIISSTMHAHQALNGVYNKPAFTERTLSEEDRARVRALYGPIPGTGSLRGSINNSGNSDEDLWIEDAHTGRVIASTSATAGGQFLIENLPASSYRVLNRRTKYSPVAKSGGQTTDEISLSAANEIALSLYSPALNAAFLNPKFIGAAGDLSVTPVPVEPGERLRLYISGQGIDQLVADGIAITSPFFKVDPASIQREDFHTSYPVISFEVTAATRAPFGDYTIRLQSKTSETAYLAGAITVDPAVESGHANPADDPRFFVRQHYRDFLGRDADTSGLEYWVGQLEQCGSDVECLKNRRVTISNAFFVEREFQQKAALINRTYRVALNRAPSFEEYADLRSTIALSVLGDPAPAYAEAVVQTKEFLSQYPATLSHAEFLDKLLHSVRESSGVNLISERAQLIALAQSANSRAAVIQALVGNNEVLEAERDREFVLLQFFTYLQRDPDRDGYKFWLDKLTNRRRNDPARFTSITCAFLNSPEYQARFGMVLTHTPAECSLD